MFLPVTAFRSDSTDDVLGVGTHELHRVHSQVLVQVRTALSSIGAQVAFVFSFLWGRNQNCSQKRKKKFKSSLKGTNEGWSKSLFVWGQRSCLDIVGKHIPSSLLLYQHSTDRDFKKPSLGSEDKILRFHGVQTKSDSR